MTDKPRERRQVVRFLFLRVDPAWRRLPAHEQVAHKKAFGETLKGFHARLLLRTYSLMGTRGDADLMLWQAAEDVETLQRLETAIFSTGLGGWLHVAYSYLAMTKRSIYEFPDDPETDTRDIISPSDNQFLFVYPFVKTRAWYGLTFEERQEAMNEHVRIGRRYPSIRLNTTYSFGLDDQEFVVAFEGDDPGEFLDLVMELRGSRASAYTERDTPVLTCIQTSVWDMLDALGGASLDRAELAARQDEEGFTPVAATADLPPGASKRVYLGADAVALFNVGGAFYAVSDRCTHGRASLSEGRVDPATCTLLCPWHGGRFDVRTGEPTGGPPRVRLKAYRVKVDNGTILVG